MNSEKKRLLIQKKEVFVDEVYPKSFEILLHCNSGVAKFSIAKQTEIKVLQVVSVILMQRSKKNHTKKN